MSHPEPPNETEHPEGLLLPYVEGLLEPEESGRVTEHLLRCPRCSSEVDGIRTTIALLKENRAVFCPDAWQVFEFLHYGHDPHNMIASHLRVCPACVTLAETLSPATQAEKMPAALWGRMSDRLPRPAPKPPRSDLWLSGLLERFSALFRMPALAAGAVVAAVLLVVVLYPRDIPQSLVALSPVTWEGTPRPKPFDLSRKRVGFLLAFKEFDHPVSQERIDALYESLAPTMDLHERFSVVSPGELKDILQRRWGKLSDTRDLVDRLRGPSGVSAVISVTVEEVPGGADVVTELIDTAGGNIVARKTERRLSDADLPHRIRQSAFALLLELDRASPSSPQ